MNGHFIFMLGYCETNSDHTSLKYITLWIYHFFFGSCNIIFVFHFMSACFIFFLLIFNLFVVFCFVFFSKKGLHTNLSLKSKLCIWHTTTQFDCDISIQYDIFFFYIYCLYTQPTNNMDKEGNYAIAHLRHTKNLKPISHYSFIGV